MDRAKAAEGLKIVGLCVLASVAYGIVHDQITARVYLPYFTVYHPHILDSNDPTVMGLLWGVIATWWAGLIVSIPIAYAALAGDGPRLPFRRIVVGVLVLLATMATWASAVGLSVYYLGIAAPGKIAWETTGFGSFEAARRYTAVLITHQTSYFVGLLGGFGLAVWVAYARRKLNRWTFLERV